MTLVSASCPAVRMSLLVNQYLTKPANTEGMFIKEGKHMLTIEVWGDFGCFTRPETKVERMSYPSVTPSAARGIFEAIYWKPEFQWVVDQIEVLSEPQYITLRRNEVKDRLPSERTIGQWMNRTREIEPLWADGTKDELGSDQKGRTQRQTVALRSPRYRLGAHIEPWPGHHDQLRKFEAQFLRRAHKGQCIYQPYLGCREFPAYFKVPENPGEPSPVNITADWGLMLYDVFSRKEPGNPYAEPEIQVFPCRIESGVIRVPHYSQLMI